MPLPVRKNPRLDKYDYSSPGAYFLTLCTIRREKLLCKIVGCGVLDAPRTELSAYGCVAERIITQMSGYYPDISIDKFVIMPNHIHLIVRITSDLGGLSRTPAPTVNAAIPRFISTFKRFTNKEFGRNIWQKSYHDHIIRNDTDYLKIANYIETNPVRWLDDCFYSAEDTP